MKGQKAIRFEEKDMFSSMSNKVLIDTYFNAVRLKLDEDFIMLLKVEMSQRGIEKEEVERMDQS